MEYRRATGDVNGLPYVLEVAFAVKADAEYGRTLRVGINFSPALSQPFTTLDNALNEARCTRHDPVVVLVHLACPAIQFTDRGKSKAILPEPIADDLQRLVKSATARFAKAKRQADRNDRMDNRAMEELRNAHKVRPMTVKTAAYQNWDQRIDLESGNRLLAMETKRGGDRKSEEYKSSGNFPIDNTQSSRADSNYGAGLLESLQQWNLARQCPADHVCRPPADYSTDRKSIALEKQRNVYPRSVE